MVELLNGYYAKVLNRMVNRKKTKKSIIRFVSFFVDYMKLKRILSKQTIQKREGGKDTKGSRTENLLFRTSGGLCFDVCPDDKTMYIILFLFKKKEIH